MLAPLLVERATVVLSAGQIVNLSFRELVCDGGGTRAVVSAFCRRRERGALQTRVFKLCCETTLLCEQFGKAVSVSVWLISPLRFIRRRGKRSSSFGYCAKPTLAR